MIANGEVPESLKAEITRLRERLKMLAALPKDERRAARDDINGVKMELRVCIRQCMKLDKEVAKSVCYRYERLPPLMSPAFGHMAHVTDTDSE